MTLGDPVHDMFEALDVVFHWSTQNVTVNTSRGIEGQLGETWTTMSYLQYQTDEKIPALLVFNFAVAAYTEAEIPDYVMPRIQRSIIGRIAELEHV